MGSRIHPRKGDPGPKGGGDIGVDDQPDDGVAWVVGDWADEVRHVNEEVGLEAVLSYPLEDGRESGPPAAFGLFQADGPIEERYRFGGADFGVAVQEAELGEGEGFEDVVADSSQEGEVRGCDGARSVDGDDGIEEGVASRERGEVEPGREKPSIGTSPRIVFAAERLRHEDREMLTSLEAGRAWGIDGSRDGRG